MSQIMEDIQYLSQDIGPRPAGTEEERRAAMYIAENISKRSGLNFNIEDFESAKGSQRALNIASILAAIVCVASAILSIITIPAFLVCALVAIVTVMEVLGKPVISGLFRFGVSQNVVAKYEPTYSADKPIAQRKRKVVFVTHYDSSNCGRGSGAFLPSSFYYFRLLSVVALCLMPVVLLVKIIAFSDIAGSVSAMFLIIGIILAILAIIPQILQIIFSRMPYNDGANCNASGTAALMEIARLLGTGAFGTQDNDQRNVEVHVHGSEAAAAAGLIPEGAEIDYSAKPNVPTAPEGGFLGDTTQYDDALVQKEKALSDAKAAVAAFTAPRTPRSSADDVEQTNMPTIGGLSSSEAAIPQQDIQPNEQDAQMQPTQDHVVSQAAVGVVPSYETQAKSGEVPSWFKNAQNKAKEKSNDGAEKPTAEPVRSRFAHTMDAMAQRKEQERLEVERKEEEKRAKLRQQIEAANLIANQKAEEEIGESTPFFRNENGEEANAPQAQQAAPTAAPVVKESSGENLSLDERFKRRQQDTKPAVKAVSETPAAVEAPATEPVVDQTPAASVPVASSVPADTQASAVVDAPTRTFDMPQQQDSGFFKANTGQLQAIDDTASTTHEPKTEVNNEAPKTPSLRPESSGSIDLDSNKQYAPLDDSNFVKTPTVTSGADAEKKTQGFDINNLPNFDNTDNQATQAIPMSELPLQADTNAGQAPAAVTPVDNINAGTPANEVAPISEPVPTTSPATATTTTTPETTNETTDSQSFQEHEKGKFGTGSFKAVSQKEGVAGATGTFASITGELVAEGEVDSKDDLVIDDADDQAFTKEEFTEAGAFAGPGYVEMPDKKRKGLFGIFGRNKDTGKHAGGTTTPPAAKEVSQPQPEITPQENVNTTFNPANEMLDVNDDIAEVPSEHVAQITGSQPPVQANPDNAAGNPNAVGNPNAISNPNAPKNLDNLPKTDWEGGAFSNIKNNISSVGASVGSKIPFKKNQNDNKQDNVDSQGQVGDMQDQTMQMPPVGSDDGFDQFYNQNGFIGEAPVNPVDTSYQQDPQSAFDTSAPITSGRSKISSMLEPVPNFDEQIQDFHDGSINLEVWMVALGSEIGENSGMRNFLLEHSADLRGAIIVDIEALGSGELSLVEGEGLIKKINVSPRLKRYVRRAANKMGVSVPSVRLPWLGSSAAYANKYGFNAIKLAGVENNKPAHYMQDDDTINVIDENVLTQNIKYLIKLIQSV